MPRLAKCPTCEKDIAITAKSCPNCGEWVFSDVSEFIERESRLISGKFYSDLHPPGWAGRDTTIWVNVYRYVAKQFLIGKVWQMYSEHEIGDAAKAEIFEHLNKYGYPPGEEEGRVWEWKEIKSGD